MTNRGNQHRRFKYPDCFSDHQWQEIVATIPEPKPPTDALSSLRAHIETTILAPGSSASLSPPVEAWNVEQLKTLRRIARDYDRLPMDWFVKHRRDVADLIDVISDFIRRNRGINRDTRLRGLLYEAIFRIWTGGTLKQKLTASKTSRSYFDGPLTLNHCSNTVRFLNAMLRPILGENTPTPSSLTKYVEREIKRRDADKKLWQSFPGTKLNKTPTT